jgi:hypothetical protein
LLQSARPLSPGVSSQRSRSPNPAKLKQKSEVDLKDIMRVAFPFEPDSPKHGIIAYLTQRCGGNVHERGAVRVIGNPVNSQAPY